MGGFSVKILLLTIHEVFFLWKKLFLRRAISAICDVYLIVCVALRMLVKRSTKNKEKPCRSRYTKVFEKRGLERRNLSSERFPFHDGKS